jgi:hypothetical protein
LAAAPDVNASVRALTNIGVVTHDIGKALVPLPGECVGLLLMG